MSNSSKVLVAAAFSRVEFVVELSVALDLSTEEASEQETKKSGKTLSMEIRMTGLKATSY